MSEEPGGVDRSGAAGGRTRPRRRISPRMSMLLVGGAALGGVACMCALIAVLALWGAS